jgi:SulP family sulfate permease
VVVVVATNDLSIGVVVGVIVAMVIFARRVARFATVSRTLVDVDTARYHVDGELFFATSNDLTQRFDYAGDPDRVIIDLRDSHVWDASTVAALDAITNKYARRGKSVEILGMNTASTAFHTRLSGNLGTESG